MRLCGVRHDPPHRHLPRLPRDRRRQRPPRRDPRRPRLPPVQGRGTVTGDDLLAVEYDDDEAPAYARLLLAKAADLSRSVSLADRALAGRYQAVAAEVIQ